MGVWRFFFGWEWGRLNAIKHASKNLSSWENAFVHDGDEDDCKAINGSVHI